MPIVLYSRFVQNTQTRMSIPDFGDPSVWISLLTLTFLEIVLGVDNIIFISIISDKLNNHNSERQETSG